MNRINASASGTTTISGRARRCSARRCRRTRRGSRPAAPPRREGGLGVLDGRHEVAAADVELDDDAARLLLAVDEHRAGVSKQRRHVAERHHLAGLRRAAASSERVRGRRRSRGRTSPSCRSGARPRARRRPGARRDRLGRQVDVGDREAVARELGAVGLDAQVLRPWSCSTRASTTPGMPRTCSRIAGRARRVSRSGP
jgi:hypothetical protein